MLYAQDLAVGQRFPFGTYRMEEAEIIEFATRYDPLYIHIDPEAAAKGPFGGLIASGLHTMAVYQRLIAEAMWSKVAGIAGKRFEIDLQRPVRPGTVLTGEAEIESIAIRPERNDALMTIRAVVTDGSKPMLSLRLESLIHARPA
ncbi:MAG TPA: MaoC/PaaZ C-terminal domain-containing protein [Xanthobacteraceae bacterium]|nr:MaoC/PaaZ C-terminal domain-containing protein [Xanthobacteraceae bacterium]